MSQAEQSCTRLPCADLRAQLSAAQARIQQVELEKEQERLHTHMFARAADTEKAEAQHWRQRAEAVRSEVSALRAFAQAVLEMADDHQTDELARCVYDLAAHSQLITDVVDAPEFYRKLPLLTGERRQIRCPRLSAHPSPRISHETR